MVRFLDVLISLLLLPVAILLATPVLAIKLIFDGLPLFYNSRRIGQGGISFTVYKFRTMIRDPDLISTYINSLGRKGFEIIPVSSPVYTRMGRFFERLQIVELPQIWNVLQGNMSLVGYRPLPERHCNELASELGEHAIQMRHAHKPGITGLTQLMGKTTLSNGQRVAHEIALAKFLYSSKTRFKVMLVYLLILAETLIAVLLRRKIFTPYLQHQVLSHADAMPQHADEGALLK